MAARVHVVAGSIALLLIAAFWSVTVLCELFWSPAAVAAVKRAILYGVAFLIPALMVAGGSGFALSKGRGGKLIDGKKARMRVMALNGLRPCALRDLPGPESRRRTLRCRLLCGADRRARRRSRAADAPGPEPPGRITAIGPTSEAGRAGGRLARWAPLSQRHSRHSIESSARRDDGPKREIPAPALEPARLSRAGPGVESAARVYKP